MSVEDKGSSRQIEWGGRRVGKTHDAIYRAVAGAVRNVAHAHPTWDIQNRDIARSIAKRATGTLAAQWPEVLAAKPSEGRADTGPGLVRRRRGRLAAGRPLAFSSRAFREISALVRPAKDAGNTERVQALIDVLRILDGIRRRA